MNVVRLRHCRQSQGSVNWELSAGAFFHPFPPREASVGSSTRGRPWGTWRAISIALREPRSSPRRHTNTATATNAPGIAPEYDPAPRITPMMSPAIKPTMTTSAEATTISHLCLPLPMNTYIRPCSFS